MSTIVSDKLWGRILDASWGDLPAADAQAILRLRFADRDLSRMERLSERAQDGSMTDAERAELEEYLRMSHVVALMQSQARLAISRHLRGRPTKAAAPRRSRRAS